MELRIAQTTKIIAIPFIISMAILSLGMGISFNHFAHLDAQVILHFNNATPPMPDARGDGHDVLLIVLAGMFIVLINYLLAKKLQLREEFLSTVLSISSVFVAILILISVFVIIANN